MDVPMAVFHVFPKYKNTNKIKFIEIIEKKDSFIKNYHNQTSKNDKIK